MTNAEPRTVTGGCQCGAVRYRAVVDLSKVHYCHCRMCQRAAGNAFALLVPGLRDEVAWTGEPATFRSSSVAARGFCRDCGTPLSFAYDGSRWMCVTLGSLDDPGACAPRIHFGVEGQLPWLHIPDELPRERTDEARFPGMVNNQRAG